MERLSRNYKLDLREDYHTPKTHESVEDNLMDIASAMARRLVHVNDVLWITRRKKLKPPQYIYPELGINYFKIPEEISKDEEKIKSHLLKVKKKKKKNYFQKKKISFQICSNPKQNHQSKSFYF